MLEWCCDSSTIVRASFLLSTRNRTESRVDKFQHYVTFLKSRIAFVAGAWSSIWMTSRSLIRAKSYWSASCYPFKFVIISFITYECCDVSFWTIFLGFTYFQPVPCTLEVINICLYLYVEVPGKYCFTQIWEEKLFKILVINSQSTWMIQLLGYALFIWKMKEHICTKVNTDWKIGNFAFHLV
jgi:hypothetical protein